MKIRTIRSILAKEKINEKGLKYYSDYDAVYYYPSPIDIWRYLRGYYSSCHYSCSDGSIGYVFHCKYDTIKDKNPMMRMLVYAFYYLKLRSWIEKSYG
jgi:hypothetical protein